MRLSILGERKKENRAKRLAFRGRYVVDIHFKQLRCTFTITLYWPAKQFIPKAGKRQLPLQKADRRELWCWERSDWLTAGSVASTRPCVNVCNQPCPFRDHTRGEAETVAAKIRKIAYANHYISIFDRHFFFIFQRAILSSMTFIGSAEPGSYYQAGASASWQGRLPLPGLSGYFSFLVRHISTGG